MHLARWLVLAPLAALLAGACTTEEIGAFPKPCKYAAADEECYGDVPVDTGPIEVDTGPEPWAGTPCETNGDCPSDFCVTKETLASFGVTNPPEIPGGMCSKLLCQGDSDCGPQGVCFDATAIAGSALNICLRKCTELPDCRWGETYSCYEPEPDLQPDPENPIAACLPDELVVQIVCDDGHCDGLEGGR